MPEKEFNNFWNENVFIQCLKKDLNSGLFKTFCSTSLCHYLMEKLAKYSCSNANIVRQIISNHSKCLKYGFLTIKQSNNLTGYIINPSLSWRKDVHLYPNIKLLCLAFSKNDVNFMSVLMSYGYILPFTDECVQSRFHSEVDIVSFW